MDFYHGTDQASTGSLMGIPSPVNKINITLGGGELGQGFYLGDNLTLSIAWAKSRYPNPSVLQFDGANQEYVKLSFKQMRRKEIFRIWRQMKILGTLRTHQFHADVVFGPLVTNAYAAQYKFETPAAERFLNEHCTITKIL